MKKVLAFGTFDLFHRGHEFYLREAKKLGDTLEVVVARDSTVKELKGEFPRNDERKRLETIDSLDYVDKAYLGNEGDEYKIIEELKPDIICLGYDQTYFTDDLEEILRGRGLNPRVVRIKSYRPDVYKSSKLRS